MPRLCPLCPCDDGINVSHDQAGTAIAKLAGFECDLLHIAELFSSPRCSFLPPRCAGQDAIPHREITALYAADEPKRLAFINLLVDEKAKDKLARQALRGRLAELGLQAKK